MEKKELTELEKFVAYIIQFGIDVETLRDSEDWEEYNYRSDLYLDFDDWCWLKSKVEEYTKLFRNVKVNIPSDWASLEDLEREF